MLDGILGGRSMEVARAALDGLSRRQGAIANNIANIDTPGYQRRAVTFEDALRQSAGLDDTSGPRALRATDPRHFTGPGGSTAGGTSRLPGGAAESREIVSSRNDANTVSIDEEMALLAETQIRYQALTQTLGRRLATLRTVIRGQ